MSELDSESAEAQGSPGAPVPALAADEIRGGPAALPFDRGPTMPRVSRRLGGIDLARGLAIIGMFATHIGPTDAPGWAGRLYGAPHGRASILFVLIAGVGISLLSRSRLGPVATRLRLVWYAAVLLPLGLWLQLPEFYHGIWVVLHHYAALFLLAILVLGLPDRRLLVAALAAEALGPLAYLVIHMADPGMPVFRGVSLAESWGVILRGLFVSGPYPLLTWSGPFLVGMWLGRQDLRAMRVRLLAVLGGLSVTLAAIGISLGLQAWLGEPPHATPPGARFTWLSLVSEEAHGQMPLWMIGATGSAVLVVGLALIVADRFPRVTWPVRALGQVALSVYVLHLFVLHLWRPYLSSYVVWEAWVLLAGFAVAAILFAVAWRRVLPRGPLELVLHLPEDAIRAAARRWGRAPATEVGA